MTKKNRYLLAMSAVFALIASAFAIGANADMQGESVTHTGCVIKDKPKTAKSKDQAQEPYHYHIDSTCGLFLVNRDLYETIIVDETYDLVTTKGNWAHKATLLSATRVF